MKNQEILWKKDDINSYVKVIGQVYIKDFKSLVNTKGARALNAMGIKNLQESYNEFGICSTPIVVKQNKKYEVIDGWHRIYVAKQNKKSIICTIVEPSNDPNDVMIALNRTQLNWKPIDYLNNGIEYHENDDYIFLREVFESSGISLVALYVMYAYDVSPTELKTRFEQGTWNISTKTLGNNMLQYVDDLYKLTRKNKQIIPFARNANFVKGYVVCASKKRYNHEHLLKQIKKFPNLIHDGDKPLQHAAMINKIYNYCVSVESLTAHLA